MIDRSIDCAICGSPIPPGAGMSFALARGAIRRIHPGQAPEAIRRVCPACVAEIREPLAIDHARRARVVADVVRTAYESLRLAPGPLDVREAG